MECEGYLSSSSLRLYTALFGVASAELFRHAVLPLFNLNKWWWPEAAAVAATAVAAAALTATSSVQAHEAVVVVVCLFFGWLLFTEFSCLVGRSSNLLHTIALTSTIL